MMKPVDPSLLATAESVLALARKAGATEADVVAARSTEFEVKVADGEIVTLTQATSKGLGLRVFVDDRLGFCTTSDFTADNLTELVDRAVLFARETADDPHNGIGDIEPGRIDTGEDLDLYDPQIPALAPETKIEWAHALEEAARSVDPRVCKFQDSGVVTDETDSILVTSTGAVRTLRSTGISAWCNPLAEHDGELQTEVWWDSRTHLEDLESIETIGRTAGTRAVRMLGARPISTQRVAVIFEPHMAAGLLGGMIPAIDGDMVYKRASFLADQLGEEIAVSGLTVVDDPHLRRGTASCPFDGEGRPTYRKALIDRGRLTTFLYDTYTARKAGAVPTASARRSYASLPHAGPFNLYVEAGTTPLGEIIASSDKAFLMTRGLGQGVNTVSGEYSRGANGLWIEGGEIVHPVQEVTVAGDFLAMLGNIDAIGDDLTMRGSHGAPTLRIAEMTVSGA